MTGFLADVRRTCRSLVHQRALTLTALFSLTLGIGVTTGTFTLLNAMILRPIPGVERQDRLLALGLSLPERDGHSPPWWLSLPDLRLIERDGAIFSAVAGAARTDAAVRVADAPVLVHGELVTPAYFDVLGTRPLRGRFITPATARESDATVVVSHDFWQNSLGGRADVVGSTLVMNGHAFTVIGVAPPGFHGMTPADALAGSDRQVAFWVPITAVDRVHPAGIGPDPLHAAGERWLRVVGRVREGLDASAARARVRALGPALAEAFPAERAGARLEPGDLVFGPGTSPARGTVMIAAFLVVPLIVLLVACINVASLLLASGVSRQRELALRLSLGASRRHIVALLLRESLLLALAAGALSLVFAAWTRHVAAAFSIRPAMAVPIDGRVLLFALAAALLTGLVFGALPALRVTRIAPARVIAGGASSESGGTARLRGALVAAQLALCFIMLIACSLFLRSTGSGMRVATGYAEDELLFISFDLEVLGLGEAEGTALYDRIADAARALPGVAAVGPAAGLPLAGARDVRVATGTDAEYGARARADVVGPGWFEAAGVALLAGRGFDRADRGVPAGRVLVNRALAARLWPGESPIGRTLRLGEPGHARDLAVVGIVEDVRASLTAPPEPLLYLPLEAAYTPRRTLLFRLDAPAERVIPALRQAIAAADPRLPLVSLGTMRDLREEALLPLRLTSAGLGLLGAIALLLATVGLFGLVSYNVSRRTREIGIRVALGATRGDIGRWVLRGSLATTAAGLAFGAPLAALLAFAIRRGLFGIRPLDPLSFGAITALLVAVSALGAWLPARRAAAIEPSLAIRVE